MLKYIIILLLTALSASIYAESSQDTTKCSYNLFHPTPKDKMRSFETDRPDATESPYTVDAGHFQYETDLIKTEWITVNAIKTINKSFNVFNFKTGLTNSLDIQFISESFVYTKVTNVISETKTSFSTITIRAKQNIWGNDKGKTALAILPFVNIPTISNTKITGGIVFPISIALSNDWDFGAQIEFDVEDNQSGVGYHTNPLVSATIGHKLIGKINFFAESVITKENELKRVEYYLNGGLVYEWNKNLNLDTGLYYGLKNISSKAYFIGLSIRY